MYLFCKFLYIVPAGDLDTRCPTGSPQYKSTEESVSTWHRRSPYHQPSLSPLEGPSLTRIIVLSTLCLCADLYSPTKAGPLRSEPSTKMTLSGHQPALLTNPHCASRHVKLYYKQISLDQIQWLDALKEKIYSNHKSVLRGAPLSSETHTRH